MLAVAVVSTMVSVPVPTGVGVGGLLVLAIIWTIYQLSRCFASQPVWLVVGRQSDAIKTDSKRNDKE